jgi:hypothetical protein
MILNSYAVLLAFVAVLRLIVGFLLVFLGARSWVAARQANRIEDRDELGDRFYLLLLLALLLIWLNLISWPLLYALLQSYVSEFSGVMCIYGVTRVGEGSLGSARHLPSLLVVLQFSKPALVFAGGTWFALYLLNRACASGPLLPRLLIMLVPLGALASLDGIVELAYLVIPKVEDVPSAGCCTIDRGSGSLEPPGLTGESARGVLTALFFAGAGAMVAALTKSTWKRSLLPGARTMTGHCIGALALTAIGGVFLVDVAAPTLLGLPLHRCPYDLIERVPEAVVAIVLFLGGGYCVGWAWALRVMGMHPETAEHLPTAVHSTLRAALWCYFCSVTMLSIELALA